MVPLFVVGFFGICIAIDYFRNKEFFKQDYEEKKKKQDVLFDVEVGFTMADGGKKIEEKTK